MSSLVVLIQEPLICEVLSVTELAAKGLNIPLVRHLHELLIDREMFLLVLNLSLHGCDDSGLLLHLLLHCLRPRIRCLVLVILCLGYLSVVILNIQEILHR